MKFVKSAWCNFSVHCLKEYVNSDKEMEVAPLLEKINKNIEEFTNKQLENTQEPENK